jgi:hypothetical protein
MQHVKVSLTHLRCSALSNGCGSNAIALPIAVLKLLAAAVVSA